MYMIKTVKDNYRTGSQRFCLLHQDMKYIKVL